jgi:hypothetical protein
MATKSCNTNYKVEFFLVESTTSSISDMQKKINQWITTGKLKKFKSSIVGSNILFEVIKIKG